ncbi:MAG: tetratricopeptide repeat protein [Gaiellaceae bacterium]
MTGPTGDQLIEEARANYDAGDYRGALDLVVGALADRPNDPELLRLAGKSSFELGLDDAAEHLARAAELEPDDVATWRDLGAALIDQGRLAAAADAFRNVMRLRPDDVPALVDLGHTAYTLGQTEEAIASLRQAAEHEPGDPGALRGLVEINRREGRLEDALDAAERARRLDPADVSMNLDAAELALALGRLDEAKRAFARLRALDDDPEHEVYAFHGMIEAELRRDRWRPALDLAIDATRVDRLGRTTDVLAFVVAQVFGDGDRPTPSRTDVEAALTASRYEHRRLHEEALVL